MTEARLMAEEALNWLNQEPIRDRMEAKYGSAITRLVMDIVPVLAREVLGKEAAAIREHVATIAHAYSLSGKADAWADRMPHDRRAIVKLLRDKRDYASRKLAPFQSDAALKASRIAAFDAAIALLEAAEDRS